MARYDPELRRWVGELVLERRVSLGYGWGKQQQFAERAGVGKSTLGMLEGGKVVSDESLIAILKALGMDLSDLDAAIADRHEDDPQVRERIRLIRSWSLAPEAEAEAITAIRSGSTTPRQYETPNAHGDG
jgi:transcriptional regulator with XRE-family HTH domain